MSPCLRQATLTSSHPDVHVEMPSLAVVTRHARVCGVCGLGAWDRVWSGDGLVIRRREGAAVAQYHRGDRC